MIIGEIRRYLRDNNTIRVSRSVRDLAYRALQARERLQGTDSQDPTVEQIEERLIPFVEKIRKAHPDIPLIFQQTIYRESRNFSVVADEREKQKMEAVEKMMKRVCRKFDNVYFIHPCATSPSHETSVDATHPDDYGYTLWAESIKKDVLDILDKKR